MYSLTVSITACGEVKIQATDRAGGGSYLVGYRPPGGLEGLTDDAACSAVAAETALTDRRFLPFMSYIREAISELLMCLPEPEIFDDDGRPKR